MHDSNIRLGERERVMGAMVLPGPGLGPPASPPAGPARSPWARAGQASMIFCGPGAGLKLVGPGRARAGK